MASNYRGPGPNPQSPLSTLDRGVRLAPLTDQRSTGQSVLDLFKRGLGGFVESQGGLGGGGLSRLQQAEINDALSQVNTGDFYEVAPGWKAWRGVSGADILSQKMAARNKGLLAAEKKEEETRIKAEDRAIKAEDRAAKAVERAEDLELKRRALEVQEYWVKDRKQSNATPKEKKQTDTAFAKGWEMARKNQMQDQFNDAFTRLHAAAKEAGSPVNEPMLYQWLIKKALTEIGIDIRTGFPTGVAESIPPMIRRPDLLPPQVKPLIPAPTVIEAPKGYTPPAIKNPRGRFPDAESQTFNVDNAVGD